MDIYKLLCELDGEAGASGYEMPVSAVAEEKLMAYGDTQKDFFGNVYCRVGDFSQDMQTLMLDAHIDEIGLVVTFITDDGFLKVSNLGGIDRRLLLAQQVTVCGKQRVKGIVTSVPPHLEKEHSKVPAIDEISVDIGMTKAEAETIVSIGDSIVFENMPLKLMNNVITGKALDDRSGIAAVLCALDMLKGKKTKYNVAVLFSAQEETGERGAKIGAYKIMPDLAIAVDVSFAKSHDESEEKCGVMGKGAMIGIAPSLSCEMSEALFAAAKNQNIPYQIEVMNGLTGTNADAVCVTGGGVKTATVSIPLKYMHTPVEACDLRDIENTARLLAEFVENGGI